MGSGVRRDRWSQARTHTEVAATGRTGIADSGAQRIHHTTPRSQHTAAGRHPPPSAPDPGQTPRRFGHAVRGHGVVQDQGGPGGGARAVVRRRGRCGREDRGGHALPRRLAGGGGRPAQVLLDGDLPGHCAGVATLTRTQTEADYHVGSSCCLCSLQCFVTSHCDRHRHSPLCRSAAWLPAPCL